MKTKPSNADTASDFEKYGYELAGPSDETGEDYFRLVCPIDSCDCTETFFGLGQVRDSDWTRLSIKNAFLKGGGVIHEAYCPDHYIKENYDPSRDIASHEFTSYETTSTHYNEE
jgi:hypothetical protein